ncbi:MAG TPA: hypothetical protein VF256_03240, partial [Streptosporangiaceae bacterium]
PLLLAGHRGGGRPRRCGGGDGLAGAAPPSVDPGQTACRRAGPLGLVLVAGCLWELLSLLEQPTLTTSSYAHPTISTLTDPVLGSWAGRSAVLAGWLGLGWFLAER